MTYLQLLPAVDITEGRAVQLAQGVAGSERVYGDPVGPRPAAGRTPAPSGCTSSTSTPPSGAAPTASSRPRSWPRSTSTSR